MALSFVPAAAPVVGEVVPQPGSLRGSENYQHASPHAAAAQLVTSALAVAAVGVIGARATKKSVTCRATAVKKKGVRVVEGKEIPWNLFSPKAPYQGKVV